MKFAALRLPVLSCLLLAGPGVFSATAGLVSLTSPDGKWRLSSDEFGAYGEAADNSFAQRDFGNGAGLTGYSWASSLLLTEGSTRQWVTGTDLEYVGQSLLTAGSLIADSTVGNVRTSAFNVPGFANLRIDLVQTVSNAGITQKYSFTNNRATALTLGVTTYHDVDLDEDTAGNDVIALVNGTLRVSEGGRNVFFAPGATGYVGFLGGLVTNGVDGGVTTNLDAIAYNSFGLPGAYVNQFHDVDHHTVGVNVDTNGDLMTDYPSDVGYLFQNNLTIPAGGSVSMTVGTQLVPEPSSALLGLLGIGVLARRRRASTGG